MVDSIRTKKINYENYSGGAFPPAHFSFSVTVVPGDYRLMVEMDKYEPLIVDVNLNHIGTRELKKNLGLLILKKEPKNLAEVTVTATKVKFYNRGDTIVFNADAFDLPEGSMLDALVARLPGVELKENGQIFVNGKFVDNLILNGKDFFKGDNKVLLNNLGAYTVKDIRVYDKLSKKSEWAGQNLGDSEYVMDVKLKREYSVGYNGYLHGGIGTSDRYLARGFLMGFTSRSRIGVTAGINDLNVTAQPFSAVEWDPSDMREGRNRAHEVNMEWSTSSDDNKTSHSIKGKYSGNALDSRTNSTRTNFLPSGNNYTYNYSNLNRDSWRILAYHSSFWGRNPVVMHYLSTSLRYNHDKANSRDLSGTFNSEQKEITESLLESLYTDGNTERLAESVNKITNANRLRSNSLATNLWYATTVKVPHTSDLLNIGVTGDYGRTDSKSLQNYLINTGQTLTPYTDMSQRTQSNPLNNYHIQLYLGYQLRLSNDLFIETRYMFDHTYRQKNSYLYRLDRLAEAGIYSLAEDDYTFEPDPANTFESAYRDNQHGLRINSYFSKKSFWINLDANVYLRNNRIAYAKAGERYSVARTTVVPEIRMLRFGYSMQPYGTGEAKAYRNRILFEFNLNSITPDLAWLVPVTDSSDPMNIMVGCESLKNQLNFRYDLKWEYKPRRPRLTHTLQLSYIPSVNTLVRGYNYDTATGVRTISSANASGNWAEEITSITTLQFGRKKEFTLSNTAMGHYSHATDFIGIDEQMPRPYTVKNTIVTDKARLDWNIMGQTLSLKVNAQWRKTRSERETFVPFSATTVNYGIAGTFKLPYNFRLSTEATLYTRHGYQPNELNGTDLVWNARLSYSMLAGKLTLIADAFDILRQLNNVKYLVDAQGRTISYSNVLPRFFMVQAQYRFDIKPRKF